MVSKYHCERILGVPGRRFGASLTWNSPTQTKYTSQSQHIYQVPGKHPRNIQYRLSSSKSRSRPWIAPSARRGPTYLLQDPSPTD